MNDDATINLCEKLLMLAKREIDNGAANSADAVEASLMATMLLARVAAKLYATDEEFDASVDVVARELKRQIMSWKGGA